MDHRIIDSQHNWPNPVNDSDSGQPSTWQDWDFDGQNNSYDNYAQSVAQNVFDEFLNGGTSASPDTQVIKKKQGSVGSEHGCQMGFHVASAPSLAEKHGNNLQDNMQPTSCPAADYGGSDCGQAAVSVDNKCDETCRASPESHSSKELHPEPLQVPRLDQNMMSLAIGQGGNEHAKHEIDVKLEKSSSMMGSLLNTPAFQYDQGRPLSIHFQSPFQSQNNTSRVQQQQILPNGPIPAKRRQKGQTEMLRSQGIQGLQGSRSNIVSFPNLSSQLPAYQNDLISTSSSSSNETINFNGGQQQTQNYLPQLHIPSITAFYNPPMPFPPNHNQQQNLSSSSMTVGQIAIIRQEQISRLRGDIFNEVKLHLQIMTAYFTHALKHLSRDFSPAAAQAKQHWLESAKVWLSTVPEAWKNNLPVTQSRSHPVEKMIIQKIHIQGLVEAARRHKIPNKTWPHTPEEWKQDISITAHWEELKLMKTWTAMFNGMLQDLRSKFPLLEDALEEIRAGGGWDQLLGGDDVKTETDEDS
ncbi:hypothetical protein EPUS_07068 [Endocarpon pusillum Z07020]|uniref:Uncharacterized protein n=1 Tax=Endocarpon pusillum (strain Z07020 / HMAS-L-300199) TaxID=1263415 RepID=U1GW88_ENDPU|nr:uncharacterized protein EPUS_07068 [Endocarpon pusillum Z07020]ERF76361.1 hypothetical protein EPUS_07068 [Endocarpon pusillum Z07020]